MVCISFIHFSSLSYGIMDWISSLIMLCMWIMRALGSLKPKWCHECNLIYYIHSLSSVWMDGKEEICYINTLHFFKPNCVLLNCPVDLLGWIWRKGKLDLKCFPSSQLNLPSLGDEIREGKPQKCSHRPSKLSDGRMKIPLSPFLECILRWRTFFVGHT